LSAKERIVSRALACFGVFVPALFCQFTGGADWPQYRADGGRTGYTSEQLTAELHLQWTYLAQHTPEPAWPDVYWQRQTYDLAYQPVIADGTLFYGSSADCKVYALGAATGHERWSFFTEGPVRFAPVVWRDRVFVASDDGWLYCLRVADGGLLWKRPGGPDRQRILGNGRMTSRCPMRGGPVLHDGVLYFGAGIFPTQGFFLHALDPATGDPLWVNDTAGHVRAKHITGGYSFGNVVAQGYLAASGDSLAVPTGRAVPAVFDRGTGEFRHFRAIELSYAGGSWIMAIDKLVFNSDMILDIDTGYTLCNKVGNPAETVQVRNRPAAAEAMLEAAASSDSIVVATGQRIKMIDRGDMFDRGSSLWEKTQGLYFQWRGPTAESRTPHRCWPTRDRWSLPVACQGTVIIAGDKVYVGGSGSVSAVDLGKHEIVWSHPVEGTAYALAVAGGRLYASTDAGRIYCFAAESRGDPPVLQNKPTETLAPDAGDYDIAAQAIIDRTGLRSGYCLDIGCGRGELSYALAKRTDLHIIAIDNDPATVAEARRRLDAAGLYGVRVTVLQADSQATHLPNYFANLVVSGRSIRQGADAVSGDDWRRSLRPYGGVAAFGKPDDLKIERRGPLEGAGSWTHQFADAANTSCSGDQILKGPLGVLWFGGCGPRGMPMEKSRSPAPLWVEGRLYVQGTNFLRCLDAYNGHLMWEKQITPFAWSRCYNGSEVVGSNYCVTPDSVYISALSRCRRLDGVTGEELGSFETPQLGQQASRWMQVFVHSDLLLGTLESETVEKGWPRPDAREIPKSMMVAGLTQTEEATHLFAMDRRSGALRWSYTAKDLIIPNSIAIGRGRVYLIDAPAVDPQSARRGVEKRTPPGRLVALDSATGNVLWRRDDGIIGSMLAFSEEHDVVLMSSDVKERGTLFNDYPQVLAVFRGSDGSRIWQHEVLCKQRPMIIGRTIIAEGFNLDEADRNNAMTRQDPSAWDLLTGETRMRSSPVTGEPEPWIYGRSTKCSYVTGCQNLLLFRNAMTTYYDLLRDEGQSSLGGFRPSCFINVLPVGGIVVAPNTFAGCQCNTPLRTTLAFEPVEQEERWAVFSGKEPESGVLRELRLNLGAMGDRRDDEGRLWFAFPRPPGYFSSNRSDTKTVKLDRVVSISGFKPNFRFRYDMAADLEEAQGVSTHRINLSDTPVRRSATPWVSGSCCRGPLVLQFDVSRMPSGTQYNVRLHFAELENVKPGERVFDVRIGNQIVLEALDVTRESGGSHRTVVRECRSTANGGGLQVSLLPRKSQPILNGLEIVAASAD